MASRSARPTADAKNRGERILVGVALRPHGLRGEIRIEVLSDVAERFAAGGELWLLARGLEPRRVRISSSRPVAGGAVIGLEGIADRDAAEALRGARFEVEPAAVPAAPPGVYYHFELIGCRCSDARDGELGEVTDVVEDGGGHLLEIGDGTRTLLVPFVEAFLLEVDVANRSIRLQLPPGLIETCASRS